MHATVKKLQKELLHLLIPNGQYLLKLQLEFDLTIGHTERDIFKDKLVY